MSPSSAGGGGAPRSPDDDLPADQQPTTATSGAAPPTPSAAKAPEPAVPSTRASTAWLAVPLGLALLVVVIVFIAQNSQDVRVGFFGAHWTLPLGVDLLLAAVLGGAAVFLLGTVRILQLRRTARRHRATHLRSEEPATPSSSR